MSVVVHVLVQFAYVASRCSWSYISGGNHCLRLLGTKLWRAGPIVIDSNCAAVCLLSSGASRADSALIDVWRQSARVPSLNLVELVLVWNWACGVADMACMLGDYLARAHYLRVGLVCLFARTLIGRPVWISLYCVVTTIVQHVMKSAARTERKLRWFSFCVSAVAYLLALRCTTRVIRHLSYGRIHASHVLINKLGLLCSANAVVLLLDTRFVRRRSSPTCFLIPWWSHLKNGCSVRFYFSCCYKSNTS